MRVIGRVFATLSAGLAAAASASAAVPVSRAMGMQPPATEVAEQVVHFHNFLLVIIAVITVFVTLLLAWVAIRYNKKSNPVPKQFSHNTLVEILWTTIPVLILVLIAYQSFPLLYKQDVMPAVDESEIVDVKVYGRQWYWSYIYGSGDDELYFDSNMIPDADIDVSAGQILKLSVNNPMVVPVGKYIRVSVSASDVIHAWAVPAFALKIDAVPGRLNQVWFKVDEPGVFYGQCSELCGVNHAFMPIEVRVISQPNYDTWRAMAVDDPAAARAYLDEVQPLATQVAASQ